MKNDGCRESLHKIIQFVAITPLFWIYTLYSFLAILISKRYPFSSTICPQESVKLGKDNYK